MATKAKTTKKTTASRSSTSSTRSAKKPANAALDDALFVPHLDELKLPGRALEGTGPGYSEMFESICGVTDDSQQVELYDGSLGVTAAFVMAHQLPVAQVQWNDNLATVFTNPGNVNGVRWGSGTMIGPDLFLTCGHLFDTDINGWTVPRQNGTANAITPQQAATSMRLNFEFQVDAMGNQRAEQSFPITQLIEYRLGGLDMALCRIGGSPGTTYGWSEFATANAAVGDMLAIIGHPLGQPKRIEAGPCTTLSGSAIRYNDIDTLGGNSGSGIMHSPSGRIVGVHTNGGCNSAGTGSNSGVAIAAFIAASPTLQAITPSSQTASAADGVATLRAADVVATRFAVDVGGNIPTVLANDVATPLRLDRPTTIRAADIGTPAALDTSRFRDQLGTILSGDIGTFGSGDDPDLTLVEGGFDPGRIRIDPRIRVGGGIRPFVQAGPHSGIAGEAVGEETLQTALLGDLAGLIEATAAMQETLQALYDAIGTVDGDAG